MMSWAILKKFLGRRFIDNDDGDNDFGFSSASDDNDNDKISNVTVADTREPEDEEEMEEHEVLWRSNQVTKKTKVQKFGDYFEWG